MEALLPLLAMFGLMWVLLIRPQQRRVRQHQAVVAALKEGDEVITTGGLYGTVVEVEGDTLLLEVSPDVIVRVLNSSITQRLVPPGEQDSAEAADNDGDTDDDVDDHDTGNAAKTDGDPAGNGHRADQASAPGAAGGDEQQ